MMNSDDDLKPMTPAQAAEWLQLKDLGYTDPRLENGKSVNAF